MKKWTKTAGILFVAAASVYYGQAVVAAPGRSGAAASGAGTVTEVKLLEEAAPSDNGEKPSEGRSVSKSEVQVSDEGTVEIHVNDASLVEVLRMLSLQSQKNIICSKDVRGTVTANLYNVTIREALDQVLHMNGYAYREKGNFINVYTVKELQQLEEAERKVNTEVFRLYYTPAANAMNLIKPVLSTVAQVSSTTPAQQGIPAGGTDVGGGTHATEDMLIVTDFPDNLDRVRRIIKEVDRRPQQVLVEATILRASLSEDNALGVDFNVLAGIDFDSFLTTGTGQIVGSGTTGRDGGALRPGQGHRQHRHREHVHADGSWRPEAGLRLGQRVRVPRRPRRRHRHDRARQSEGARPQQAEGRSDRRPQGRV
jgi:type II secretory pathway component GspD/PulD (secretin)